MATRVQDITENVGCAVRVRASVLPVCVMYKLIMPSCSVEAKQSEWKKEKIALIFPVG